MDSDTKKTVSFVARIRDEIHIAFHSTPPSIQHSIFKVPNRLRQEKNKNCDPEVISIGPYHHQLAAEQNVDHLTAMETHKKRYLYMLLHRRNEKSARRYIRKLRQLEKKARKLYADPTEHLNGEKFVEMMLLDGFFIIELFRRCMSKDIRIRHDPCLLSAITQDSLVRDLLLLENQLPFFVLQELFEMTMMGNEQPNHLMVMAVRFFSRNIMQGSGGIPDHMTSYSPGDIKHLLDLLHKCWRPSIKEKDSLNVKVDNVISKKLLYYLLLKCWRQPSMHRNKNARAKLDLMSCATKLQAAGIKFKKLEGVTLFDIKFERGVMWIPGLIVDRDTEKILSNLVAYEQFRYNYIDSKHVTNYVMFMDSLIDTGKDVDSLVDSGVIDNWYSNDKDVATMFNRLGSNVLIPVDDFLYSEIFKKVQKHCNRIWNRWMANLKQNYFNTPWTLFSVLAACLVIVFTITQTAYTIIPYYLPRN